MMEPEYQPVFPISFVANKNKFQQTYHNIVFDTMCGSLLLPCFQWCPNLSRQKSVPALSTQTHRMGASSEIMCKQEVEPLLCFADGFSCCSLSLETQHQCRKKMSSSSSAAREEGEEAFPYSPGPIYWCGINL